MNRNHQSVLHVTTSFPSYPGDPAGTFVSTLVRHLENQGISNYILIPRNSKSLPSSTTVHFRYAPRKLERLTGINGGIPAAIRTRPLSVLLFPTFLTSMALNIVILSKQVDLIHAHWSACGFIAGITKPLHKKPVITTLRGTDVRWSRSSAFYRFVHNNCIRLSSFIVGVSEKIVESLKKEKPWLSGKFVFIPNGIEQSFLEIKRSPPSNLVDLRLLFVGSLIKPKGIDILLRALSLIDRNIHTTIAGGGPEYSNLVNLCQSLNLTEKIEFIGPVPPSEIPSLMADHQVLVLPSYWEGRPNVVLEAMAAGMPVVGTNIDGTRELIEDGVTGFLVPPNNPKLLAKAISSLVLDRGLISKMGKKARQKIERQRLKWESTAIKYSKIYKEAIERTRSQ